MAPGGHTNHGTTNADYPLRLDVAFDAVGTDI